MEGKKKTYVLVIGLFLIVFAVAGVSFALFTYSRLGQTSTTITSGDIEFSFTEGDSVTLENAFPVADTVGASDTANMYTFKVRMASTSSAVSAKYNVTFVSANEGTNHFANDEIKYNLEKNDAFMIGSSSTGVLVSTIDGFDAGTSNGMGVVLADQAIANNQEDVYKLRIWIDEDVNYSGDIDSNGTMTGTKNSYTYSVRIKVDATATNNAAATATAEQISYSASEYTECTDLSCALNELYAK